VLHDDNWRAVSRHDAQKFGQSIWSAGARPNDDHFGWSPSCHPFPKMETILWHLN
jgi:hypothetical protein